MWEECEVTEEHILKGEPEDTTFCPIALALKDHPISNNYKEVYVNKNTIELYITDGDADSVDWLISEEEKKKINDFIEDFDQSEHYDELENKDDLKDRLKYSKPFKFKFKLK